MFSTLISALVAILLGFLLGFVFAKKRLEKAVASHLEKIDKQVKDMLDSYGLNASDDSNKK